MKSYKSEAIVLHTYPSRERDKLVVFLTPEHGKLRGFAYGARSIRSRYGASLEPLAKVTLTWFEKENDEALRLDSATMIRSLFDAQQDLRSSVAATYMAESADVFAQPSEPAELLYRLLDRVCAALMERLDARVVVTWFEIWLLKLQGIFPSVKNCHECGEVFEGAMMFDERAAGFVCDGCGSRESEIVPNDTRDALIFLLRSRIEEFAAAPPPPRLLYELRSLSRRLRRHFLGHELKSYDVLQSVL